jgi:TetR/AcrR family transcriptional repressor of nem operon
MGRPIKFDRDAVLEAGMRQFWKDGYEASSIDKLLKVCGINRGTLYNSFGTKEVFFALCLERYCDRLAARMTKTLHDRKLSAKHAIESFFLQSIKDMTQGAPFAKHGLGCLIVNCVGESVQWNIALYEALKSVVKPIRVALRARVAEIHSERVLIEMVTDHLLTTYFGMSTQARLGTSATRLRDMLVIIG